MANLFENNIFSQKPQALPNQDDFTNSWTLIVVSFVSTAVEHTKSAEFTITKTRKLKMGHF